MSKQYVVRCGEREEDHRYLTKNHKWSFDRTHAMPFADKGIAQAVGGAVLRPEVELEVVELGREVQP